MRYAIVIEFARTNVGAYAPDVPGVGVTAATIAVAVAALREALEMQLEALVEEGQPIPQPTTPITAFVVEVAIPTAA
jgi:predicted RNase H-like HicB family nuclease